MTTGEVRRDDSAVALAVELHRDCPLGNDHIAHLVNYETGERVATCHDCYALALNVVETAWVAQAKAAALREAGVKVAQMRHTISGRRVANAEWLGQVVHAMGDDVELQAERAARKSRFRPGESR